MMTEWLHCPECRKKTRVKLRDDTELTNYLVWCSWCKKEFLFDYITVVAESTLAFAVIGSIFAGDVSISFVWFFFPFLFGLICMRPCILRSGT